MPVPPWGAFPGSTARVGVACFLQLRAGMWHVGRKVRTAAPRTNPAVGEAPLPAPVNPEPVRVLFPDDFTEDDSEGTAVPGRRRGTGRRVRRLSAYGTVGLVAGVGLLRLGALLAPTITPAPTADRGNPAVMVLSPQVRVDRMADTLALATGAFDLRLRLFQSHQMECPDLARGLVVVEQRWAEYSAAGAAGGVVQDSAHTTSDRALYAGVDATERQFEQSKCPRP